jgi:PAS domain S-box-containing protein
MPQNRPEHGQRQLPAASDLMWRWAGSIGLTVVVGIAYLLAARLSLALLTTPGGVAVFWPASGIAAGGLIALGQRARLPVAVGAMVGTVAVALLGGRNFTGSLVNALCNAAEALITAGLIERYFGPRFSLDSLRQVLGLIAATIVATALSGIGGTLGFTYLRGSTAPLLTIWQHWFLSDALGILTVAPLLIGLASAAREPPSRREFTEGLVALAVLLVMSGLVVSLPREPWVTFVPIALLFPVLLWLAARCQSVFAAAGAFIVALTIVWATTFRIGIFGDLSLAIADRISLAQASILAVSLCAIVLAALFAERRQHAAALMEGETRLQAALTAGGVMAFDWNVRTDLSRRSENAAQILGLDPQQAFSATHFLAQVHPDDRARFKSLIRGVRLDSPSYSVTFRYIRPDGREVWFEEAARAEFDAGGGIVLKGLTLDITERKRAEEALRDSEARFRELADNISQFAWTADETGWIYWYNKRWYDYTGTTLEEMQGWGWQKVHHPEHVDRVVQRIRQSFENGTPWEDTFPLRGRDSSYRWFLSRALPIHNEAGELVRWFGTNTDITEQIEAEKALRELNETLEQRVEAEIRERLQIWNVSQDLLVVADLEGKYLSVNPAWRVSLGWSEHDLLGKTSQWLVHPDDRQRTIAEIAHLAAGRRTLRFENRFRHKDGSYRWLSWKAVPDEGRIYAMARDVTDLKQTEEALRQVQRDLARVGRQTTMATMTASIAHEINQPLAAIVMNGIAGLRWLDKEKPDFDEVRTVLKRIVNDSHRASDVIASIRGMFRKDTQEKVSIDINDLIRQVLALARGEIENQRVVVQLELLETLPKITAERVPLQQVVINLVANSIEAMSDVMDRTRLLSIGAQTHESGEVLITVADTGTGIDPKIMDRIFEPFFTTKERGMGMGLSICRSIVENQGGRLWASPGSPHGAIFHIQFALEGSMEATEDRSFS